MSKQRKIHLFNCDRTYKLDAVVAWLNTVKATGKSKLGFELTTELHYFSLSQMTELSSKIIPELDMDAAVFVVHAHESRLSINEENDGIEYTKIYKALLHATKDNVIIVIGGDDSYKNEDEEDKEFISHWARRKISSQFSDEFLDGRKSFIFSWDKKHREIHEKALLHFFDKTKKGQKFEYRPKRKLPLPPAMSLSTSKAAETTGSLKPEESKSQQRWGESGLQRWDTLRLEDKPKTKGPYPIASAGLTRKEHAALYTEKADNAQRLGGSEPLQFDTSWFEEKPNTIFPSTTYRENTTLSTERAGRLPETAPSQLKIKERKAFTEGARTIFQSGTVLLSTKMRYGVISYKTEDVTIWENDKKWQVSAEEAQRLEKLWKLTPTAQLELLTDSNGEVIIKVKDVSTFRERHCSIS